MSASPSQPEHTSKTRATPTSTSTTARHDPPQPAIVNTQRKPTGKPAFKLLAVDLDGTLLRSDKRLSVACVEAVVKAHKAGVRVVLASARPPRSMREVYDMLKLDTMQVHYNGAMISHPVLGGMIDHRPLKAALARQIVRVARNWHPGVLVHLEVADRWITDRDDPQYTTATALTFKPDEIGCLVPHLQNPVTKLMLMGRPALLTPVAFALRKHFGPAIDIFVTEDHILQIVAKGVDKQTAVARVAAHYKVQPSDVMAIGDATNDVKLLTWAGLGVAMHNACNKTKAAADIVVPSNDDDGVAYAIEHYLFQ